MKHLLFMLTLFIFAACTKDPQPKPPKSGEADTMRALINGEEWNAYCESAIPGFGCTKVDCQYYPDSKSFELIAAGGHTNLFNLCRKRQ